jgi:alpha-amylase
VGDGEICAFFEAPTSYTAVKCYAWNGSTEYAGGWPGQACTKVGTVNGNNVWKWTYSGTLTELPSNIIFNGTGFDQTSDLDFKNGGYYSASGAIQGVVTAINTIRHTPVVATSQAYDMLGRKVEPTTLRKGTIYIQNGKKYLKN